MHSSERAGCGRVHLSQSTRSAASSVASPSGRKHKRGRAALGWRRRHEAGVRPAAHSVAKAGVRVLVRDTPIAGSEAHETACKIAGLRRQNAPRAAGSAGLIGSDDCRRNWAIPRLRPKRRRRCHPRRRASATVPVGTIRARAADRRRRRPAVIASRLWSGHIGATTAPCEEGQSERDCPVGDKAEPTPGSLGADPRARIWAMRARSRLG
jgi:hypothetical protein